MVQFIDGLYVKNYLNTYLVANNMKPATEIGFTRSYGHTHSTLAIRSIDEIQAEYAPIKARRIAEHTALLDKFSLVYSKDNAIRVIPCDYTACKDKHIVDSTKFFVAKEKFALDRLMNAKSDREQGIAFGFPIEDIEAFENWNSSRHVNAAEMYRNIEDATDRNISIPSWLAYLSHVPSKIDIVSENISESSKKQGVLFRDFVRKNNPSLAVLVEKDFSDTLPSRTVTNPDGSIVLVYGGKYFMTD